MRNTARLPVCNRLETTVLDRPEDLTSDWLTAALGAGRVSAFSFERIGTGQMSECYRVSLRYADEGHGPHRWC